MILSIYFALLGLLILWLIHLRTRMPGRRPKRSATPARKTTSSSTLKAREAIAQKAKVAPLPNNEEREVPPELKELVLLRESDLNVEQLKELRAMTGNLKRPVGIFTPLTEGKYDTKELTELVSSDPEIATRVLRVVNSASFGLMNKITSVQYAVIYLGTTLVKDMAMRMSMQKSFDAKEAHNSPAYKKFWIASIIASSLTQRLAQHYRLADPSTLATRSLLSFIGNLAVCSERPNVTARYEENRSLFTRVVEEQHLTGANSAVIGSMLARQWRLPEQIELGIRDSLNLINTAPDEAKFQQFRELVLCYACCRIGEQIAFCDIDDIAQCSLIPQLGHEYFYLPQYLVRAQMQDFLLKLRDLKLRTEMNNIIASLRDDNPETKLV